MKKLMRLFLSVLFIIVAVISTFVLQLYLDKEKIWITYYISIIICFLFAIYGLYQLISGKSISKKHKGRLNGVITLMITLLVAVLITITSVLNIGVYVLEGKDDITFSEKIRIYDKNKNILFKVSKLKTNTDTIMKDMNSEKYNHLNLYYDRNSDISRVQVVKTTLPKTEKLAVDIFGEIEKKDLNVIFYNEEDSYRNNVDIMNEGINTIGYYQPLTGIHLNKLTNETAESLEEVFRHEYSHYIFYEYIIQNNISKSLPTWFDEGIAKYIESEGSWEYSLSYIKDAVNIREIESPEGFNKSLKKNITSEDGWYDPYMHGYYIIDYLINEVGKDSVKDIILYSRDMDFYDAFNKVVGINIDEFQEKTLIKYIKSNKSK